MNRSRSKLRWDLWTTRVRKFCRRKQGGSQVSVAGSILLLTLVLISTANTQPLYGQPINGGGFAALVNGEPITVYELEKALTRRLMMLRSRFPDGLADELITQQRKEVLEELITEKLLLSRCDQENLEIRPEAIDQWIQSRIDQMRTQDDSIRDIDDFFDLWESDFGENEEQARQQIRNRIRISELLRGIYTQEYISPTELREYYKNHLELFSTETKYRFQQILLTRSDPDLKEKLKAIQSDVENERDFAEMVAEYSVGPRSDIGGLWERTENQLNSWLPPIPTTVRGLKVGEISEPLHSLESTHVILLVERQEGRRKDFSECQQEIRSRLRAARESIQQEQFEKTLREDAEVRRFIR